MQLGGADFVATTIAINLAVEFWQPLREFVGRILDTAENRAQAIRGRVEACTFDEPSKQTLSARTQELIEQIKSCAATHKRKAHTFSRWASILAAIGGVVILFLGFTSGWNVLLLLPLAVFLLWSAMLYLVLLIKTKMIRSELGNDILSHVFEGKGLGKSCKIPEPPTTNGDSKTNGDGE